MKLLVRRRNNLEKCYTAFHLSKGCKRPLMSSKMVKHVKWHVIENYNNGQKRYPINFETWKKLDTTYLEIALDPQTGRLGLANDGLIILKS